MSDNDYRQQRAKELGLPETASWYDITSHNSNLARQQRAKELGLPETASWDDITSHNSKS